MTFTFECDPCTEWHAVDI